MFRIIISLIISFPSIANCQNTIGFPDVLNFYKGTYNAGLQNWDIKQDNNGIVYIANNDGLLSFDGRYWNLYPLPNRTNVRSVEISEDNRIYVGGQDEFGYFTPSGNGSLIYKSLTGLIPEKDRSFADVWDIAVFNEEVFFRTSNRIFRIHKDKVTVYYAQYGWTCIAACNGRLFAHDVKLGLLSFDNNLWRSVPSRGLENVEVTSILPLKNDSVLITTLKNGLFTYANDSISKMTLEENAGLGTQRVYTAVKITDEWIALATNTSGIYIIDSKGKFIQQFSKTEGLQNNNVLSIFSDKQKNLWLGLDNGIDFIAYNSAIKHINPFEQDGSGYAAIIHNERLYAGTANGLFSVPVHPPGDLSFSRGLFSQVSHTQGQVWSLADLNGNLIVSHHEGAFLVKNDVASAFGPLSGYWNFQTIHSPGAADKILAGSYFGLSFFSDNGSGPVNPVKIEGFTETSRYVAADKYNNIWVSHPYHGIYKVVETGAGKYSYHLYTEKNGLPSTLNNHVFKIKDELLVASVKGVYIYNSTTDSFAPSPYYREILGEQSLRYLKEDSEGNVWFVHDKNLGIIDLSGKSPSVIYFPELNNKILSGFEFIYPYNKNNIFVGGERGLLLINYEKYKQNVEDLLLQIRAVRITDKQDSLLFGGYFTGINNKQIQKSGQSPDIANNWKTIRFEFASPLFAQQANLQYSSRLKGFNATWSEWSNKTEKDFSNLPAGNYSFEVKVRNNLGNESPAVAYAFTILPQWYQTYWAFALYFLFLGVSIYYLSYRQRRKLDIQQARYEEEQKRLQYLHQLELNKTESELVTLRNAKLEADINNKNTELASSAMHLVQKGELLTKIKSELLHVMKGFENPQAISDVKKMIKSLTADDNMDKEWENFTRHFDTVHSDFGTTLKEKHPGITSNDMKLSAYLRMNLSTKEIAQLMNISVRGVEISRYRLRKKLAIPTEQSLFDYLIGIQTKN